MLLNFGQPINGVAQVSFIVADIRASIADFSGKLRIGPWFLREHATFPNQYYRGRPTQLEISTAMGFAGSTMFELIQQHNDVPSVYRETIEKRGYGFHHWGYATDCFDETVARYVAQGYEVAFNAEPMPGVHVAYLDTTADLPGMIEIIEMTPAMEAIFTSYHHAAIGWDGSEPLRVRSIPQPALAGR